MLQRFSPGARNVLIASRNEASRLAQPYIGSEHILLGVMQHEHELTAPVFEHIGISLEQVRSRVEATMGRGSGDMLQRTQLTPRAINILELSLRSATTMGDGMIQVDNILLGLIEEGSGVSMQILVRLGVDLEQLYQTFISAILPGEASR
jgi:ATP-dependent Clp protease ATP-binding subunit ClpC